MAYKLESCHRAPDLVQACECAEDLNLHPIFSLSRPSGPHPQSLFFSRVIFRGYTPAHSLTSDRGCYYYAKKFREGR